MASCCTKFDFFGIKITSPSVANDRFSGSSDEDDLFSQFKGAENAAASGERIPAESSSSEQQSNIAETLPTKEFRQVLSSIISSRSSGVSENGPSGQIINDVNGGAQTNAVLPSLSKLRDKGPPRRSPSRLPQRLKREAVGKISDVAATSSTPALNEHTNQGSKAKAAEPRHSVVHKCKKTHVTSIFSSDSDEDIFSTLLTKPAVDSTKCSPVSSGKSTACAPVNEKPSAALSAVAQTSSGDNLKSGLFDSDDDIFTNSTTVNSSMVTADGKAVTRKVDREVFCGGLKATKKPDIFDSDSDDSLFL
ncbi:unnamed protein product [Gongylonema pulchrum]|uniref:CAP-ZIP_m domain-containing protein n=1 Tax=Gongylonema pulchrum TaxID=637853 RepID=A0A183D0K9_9BILA|nr:unnamed protein product [Gongylonema pulchrum]